MLNVWNRCLAQFNNPQNNIKGIHVGGTNGKGSTVAYLRTALVENGYESNKIYVAFYLDLVSELVELAIKLVIVELVSRIKPVVKLLNVKTDWCRSLNLQ